MTSSPQPDSSHLGLRRALSWILTLVWAGLIFQFSTEAYNADSTAWLLAQLLRLLHFSVSAATFHTLHFVVRKLAHLTEYALLAVLLYHSFETDHPHEWRLRRAVGAVLIAGLYSLTDEYHQSFILGRTSSLIDCGIDTAGGSLGMLILYADGRLFHAKSNRTAARAESNADR